MEVHNKLGQGFLEPVYQEALEYEFGLQGIPFAAQYPITITYKDKVLEKNTWRILLPSTVSLWKSKL